MKYVWIVIGALLALLFVDAYVIEPFVHRHDGDRAVTSAPPAPRAVPPAAVRPAPAAVPAPAPVKPETALLNLRVQNNGVALRITNRSTETYHGLLLRLVVNLDFNTYTATLIDIAPGKTILFDMREMTSSGGERFDPVKYKPLVVIEGTLADGRPARWAAQ